MPVDVEDLSTVDHVPTDKELKNIAIQIGHVWKSVGLELDLNQQEINIIAVDHANLSCVDACQKMLFLWKQKNPRCRASWKTLNQAVEKCKTISGNIRSCDISTSCVDFAFLI